MMENWRDFVGVQQLSVDKPEVGFLEVLGTTNEKVLYYVTTPIKISELAYNDEEIGDVVANMFKSLPVKDIPANDMFALNRHKLESAKITRRGVLNKTFSIDDSVFWVYRSPSDGTEKIDCTIAVVEYEGKYAAFKNPKFDVMGFQYLKRM